MYELSERTQGHTVNEKRKRENIKERLTLTESLSEEARNNKKKKKNFIKALNV